MRFVADDPPPALVARWRGRFVKTDGDLRAVMQTMIASPEFWSQGAYRVKMKSPLEMVASAVRALGADVDFSFALSHQLAQLGEPLYRKQEPTGYTNAGQDWMNSASSAGAHEFRDRARRQPIPGVKVDPARFGDAPDTGSHRNCPDADRSFREARAAIQAGLAAQADPQNNEGKRRAKPDSTPKPLVIAGLMLGSPDFQRR